MAKPKRRHLSSISARKKPKDLGGQLRDSTRSVPILRPSRPRDESDDDSWIEVKKQRVIIIIPALPKPPSKPRRIRIRDPVLLATNKQKKRGNDAGIGDKKATARQDLPNSALEMLGKDGSAGHERTKEGGRSTNANPAIDGANHVYAKRKWNNSKCNFANKKKRPVGECSKQMLYKSDQPISSMDILLASALDAEHADSASWQDLHRDDLHVGNSREDLSLDTADSGIQRKDGSSAAVPSLTKSVKARETRYPIQPVVTEPLDPKQIPGNEHDTSLLDACVDKNVPCSNNEGKTGLIQVPPILTANQAFRVSMLKKHLDEVGGFGKWLCLVGLDQFQEAFEKRRWSEVELLKLNMEDLKGMGKPAVGPRRKLIWAIQRLSRQLI